MPNTRSQENELEQPIDEIERYINLGRRIREYRLKYNIPGPNIHEPYMVAPANRPLRDYAAPSQEEPHSNLPLPSTETILSWNLCCYKLYNNTNSLEALRMTRISICQCLCNMQI